MNVNIAPHLSYLIPRKFPLQVVKIEITLVVFDNRASSFQILTPLLL